jgi:hypothetical protein
MDHEGERINQVDTGKQSVIETDQQFSQIRM